MGQSTDAYLFYGIIAKYDEGPDTWAARLGWIESDEHWYYASRDALAPDGLEMNAHCSHDYPMAFIAVKGYPVANRGYPVQVDTKVTPTPQQIERGLRSGPPYVDRIQAGLDSGAIVAEPGYQGGELVPSILPLFAIL